MNSTNANMSAEAPSAAHVTSNGSGDTEQEKGRNITNGAVHDLPQSKNVGLLGSARPTSASSSHSTSASKRSLRTVNDSDSLWRNPQRNQHVQNWATSRNRSQSHSSVENQHYGGVGAHMRNAYSNQFAQASQVQIGPDTTIAWLPIDDSVFEYQQTLFDSFTRELVDYVRYTRDLSRQSRLRIQKTVAKLRTVTTKIYPHAQLGVFGSLSTGFYLPNSDIDLVLQGDFSVSFNPTTGEKQSSPVTPSDFDVLYTLSEQLRKVDWIVHVNFIDTAKVPVLKLKTTDYQRIDITSRGQEQDHSGEAARDMFREFSQKMPELLPMTLALKQFLREQGLNHPYKGGLSSYSLTLLIIAFLQMMYHQCRKPPVNVEIDGWKERLKEERLSRLRKLNERPPAPPLSRKTPPETPQDEPEKAKEDDENDSRGILTVDPAFDENFPSYSNSYPTAPQKGCGCSLGFLLFRFLEFYGACFDYQHFGLSVRCGGYFFPLQPVPVQGQQGPQPTGVDQGNFGATAQGGQNNGVQSTSPPRFATYQSITIEDPLFPGRNAAAASYAFASIASAFESAFFSLACFRPTRFQPTLLSCLLHKEGFTDVEAEMQAIQKQQGEHKGSHSTAQTVNSEAS
eukprot:gb/GECG01008047.1/.p1 GENE.gb/GECG01008047.1/~~gb/GECG01008047.1/.p1  ORF type:complete len:624 (+),score=82.39 gb/GECG01008047.1/:1-1872(+)